VLSGLVLGLVSRLWVVSCRVMRVVVCCVGWSCVVGCGIRIFVVAVSSFQVRRHSVLSVRHSVLSVWGGEWRGATSGSGLVWLLGWCWEVPVGLIVGCGLEVMYAEGDLGFCGELCISSVGVLVVASSATSAVCCDSGGGWRNVWAVACDWLGWQCVLVVFIAVYAVVGIFRVIVVISSIIK